MRRNEASFLSTNSPMIKMVLLVLVLFTVHEARADFLPNYFVYNGGLCQSYDSTLPGTLVKLEPCILWNPKHYNWALVIPKDAPLICIGGTSICTHVADDGKIYLKKMDETDESQKWLPHDTLPDRYTNSLTGSNFCTQAMHNHGDKDKPFTDYLQMQPCSVSNVNQILLFAGAPKLRLANYFRYPFYQNSGAYGVIPNPGNLPIIYPSPSQFH